MHEIVKFHESGKREDGPFDFGRRNGGYRLANHPSQKVVEARPRVILGDGGVRDNGGALLGIRESIEPFCKGAGQVNLLPKEAAILGGDFEFRQTAAQASFLFG